MKCQNTYRIQRIGTGCMSPYTYCLITCNIKSLLNVPKISHISRKISQVSRFPAKSPDSRNKFVFLPKQPLLELSPHVYPQPATNCWFSHDVTKIQTTKLLILLRFYFHGVFEQLKTNFQRNFRFKRVLGFVIEYT